MHAIAEGFKITHPIRKKVEIPMFDRSHWVFNVQHLKKYAFRSLNLKCLVAGNTFQSEIIVRYSKSHPDYQ